MGKRGKKKKGGRRGSKAIPVAQTVMLAYPVVMRFKAHGFTTDALTGSLIDLTGFNATTQKWENPQKGIGMAIGLIALSTIGSKVASRVGANRLLKKVSGGYLKLM